MTCMDRGRFCIGQANHMWRVWWFSLLFLSPLFSASSVASDAADSETARLESPLLSHTRQLTFEGRRAGEGYFGADGRRMIFQSERESGNPFFQIYLLDFDTGDVERVSPGIGKTTCAWLHPNGSQALFASTHEDPNAVEKQRDEIAFRESGQSRRYAWDYDEYYDIYRVDIPNSKASGEPINLTNARGYDAEGSWSPDGSLIAFASNRRAYRADFPADAQPSFQRDPATAIDIYLMDSDGGKVRQLTDVAGYDGGPFFSPDGERICWRRFSENGATAEVMTMTTDGGDVRQLTRLAAMSWAPYYHPTGNYLIFTTNLHGFANFELYLVDARGQQAPVRVTFRDGFDGLPVFSPDGRQLAWTSGRTADGQSQLFIADWNHERAMQLLRLNETPGDDRLSAAHDAARESRQSSHAGFEPGDVLRHVDYLCRPELQGRRTGSDGERLATAYVAAYFDQLGLQPAGSDGAWFQPFEFTAGVDLGDGNLLQQGSHGFELNSDWRPLAFSQTGSVKAAPIVFAGYGIAAPATDDDPEYDSFVHLDVRGKWVLAFRFLPEGVPPERRQELARYASLRFKAMTARDRGAHGLVLVSGPNSQVNHQLIPLQLDGSLAGTSIPVVCVADRVAEHWLEGNGKTLQALQDELDSGQMIMGFEIQTAPLEATIQIQQVKRTGRNVLGRLGGSRPSPQMVVVGAHVDHLGKGANSSSLARDDEKDGIHFGADDNASGVAAMLEIAEYLSAEQRQGRLPMERDVLFAAWSGEELGLIGSSRFLTQFAEGRPGNDEAYPAIAACLNMDMVGRLEKRLILQGVGSSHIWRGEIERRNAVLGLPITIQEDSYLPTDASSFFMRGVPILSAFTGSHSDYHTPRDTPDKLNYDGTAAIARLMGLVARSLAVRPDPPDFVPQAAPAEGQRRANLRAYLGTIPDYAESEIKGVRLSGVSQRGPAAIAGIQAGDTIIELAGKKIENIYDYTYAIEALKIGQPVRVVVNRHGEKVTLEVVPSSRD